MKSIRLFAAVPLSPELQQKFDSILGQMASFPSDIRWVKPANLHLTLKFFGEMNDEKLPLVIDLLAKVAARHRPFSLTAEGLDAFRDLRQPKALFVSLRSGTDALPALALDIEQTSKVFVLKPGEERFKAHVTLGRVKSEKGLPQVLEKLNLLCAAPLGEMRVDSFYLYESQLTSEGSVYTRLREFFLSK